MTPRRNRLFSEQLRQAILAADVSQYRLAQQSGVAKEVIWRFVHGQVGLSLPTIDALVKALDLHLAPRKKKRKAKTRSSRGEC